ncbi:MAG: DUF2188 domain-containing protein [Desulfuromonadales bacterium]|nr:DUF2188 domain-containing protein [Desulfuromonadales bacterium]
MAQTVHMIPNPQGGWIVKRVGADRDSGLFQSRGEAENFGRQLSMELNADFEIHHLDGTVTREPLRRVRPERR